MLLIIGTPHEYYLKGNRLFDFLTKTNELIFFDPHGVISDDFRLKFSTKHKFIIIGRGDV